MTISPIDDIYISFISAGKIQNQKQHEHLSLVNEVKPCCSRCWFYKYPSFRFVPIGWELSWLFYKLSYDNFNKANI
jgi:hypothetical protein